MKSKRAKILELQKPPKYHHYCRAGTKKAKLNIYLDERVIICPLKLEGKKGKYKICREACSGSHYGVRDYSREDRIYNQALSDVMDILREFSNKV